MKINIHILATAFLSLVCGCQSRIDPPSNRVTSTVIIRGNVNSPGEYAITPDTSLLEAIIMAEGITVMGGGPQIWMTRGEERYQFNAGEMINHEPFVLVSGDIIAIPHQGSFGGMTKTEINMMNKQIEEKTKDRTNHSTLR